MKIEAVKVSQQMGSSTCAEISPLFPPLHVNETASKTGVRAPPRNKMALFEQFTVPYNRHGPSHEVTRMKATSMQHGTNERHSEHSSYFTPSTLVYTDTIKCEASGSLSTCSAIVNMDESQRVGMQGGAEDTTPSHRVTYEQVWRTDEEMLKDRVKHVSEVHVVDQSHSCEQPAGVILESFHNCEGSSAGDTVNAKSINIMEHTHQEAISNCGGLASAGSQLSGPENGESEHNMNTDVLNYVQTKGSNQLNSNDQFVECRPSLGSNADPHQKPEVISQDDTPCTVSVADTTTPIPSPPCEKMMLAMVIPSSASIKPKDVINVVGQQLFWTARKAILRQQEVFSNQVFELHKLMEVQKLLARVPGPLIGECMLLREASNKLGSDHLANEGGSNEQENLGDRRVRAPAPQKCGGQARGSKPHRKLLLCEERGGQEVRAGVLSTASFPQGLLTAPFGQPCHSLSSDRASAWGYPMGPLNRPLIYPPGSGSFLPVLPFGGAYVMAPNPPMAPFAFPCYSQRTEQTSAVFPSNQWPSATYHNPCLTPVVNDWFAVNYQGRASLASGSEKAAPTSSVPSINMKGDASTQSVQPAVCPGIQQQLGSSSRLIPTRALGSHTPLSALSRKPGTGNVGQSSPGLGIGCLAPEGWGIHEGEKKAADTEELGRSRNVKGGQLNTNYVGRAERMDIDRLHGGNALNLFPLQPSSSSGSDGKGRISRQANGQGRVIKAVPHSALAASESAAGILLSIQRERQL